MAQNDDDDELLELSNKSNNQGVIQNQLDKALFADAGIENEQINTQNTDEYYKYYNENLNFINKNKTQKSHELFLKSYSYSLKKPLEFSKLDNFINKRLDNPSNNPDIKLESDIKLNLSIFNIFNKLKVMKSKKKLSESQNNDSELDSVKDINSKLNNNQDEKNKELINELKQEYQQKAEELKKNIKKSLLEIPLLITSRDQLNVELKKEEANLKFLSNVKEEKNEFINFLNTSKDINNLDKIKALNAKIDEAMKLSQHIQQNTEDPKFSIKTSIFQDFRDITAIKILQEDLIKNANDLLSSQKDFIAEHNVDTTSIDENKTDNLIHKSDVYLHNNIKHIIINANQINDKIYKRYEITETNKSKIKKIEKELKSLDEKIHSNNSTIEELKNNFKEKFPNSNEDLENLSDTEKELKDGEKIKKNLINESNKIDKKINIAINKIKEEIPQIMQNNSYNIEKTKEELAQFNNENQNENENYKTKIEIVIDNLSKIANQYEKLTKNITQDTLINLDKDTLIEIAEAIKELNESVIEDLENIDLSNIDLLSKSSLDTDIIPLSKSNSPQSINTEYFEEINNNQNSQNPQKALILDLIETIKNSNINLEEKLININKLDEKTKEINNKISEIEEQIERKNHDIDQKITYNENIIDAQNLYNQEKENNLKYELSSEISKLEKDQLELNAQKNEKTKELQNLNNTNLNNNEELENLTKQLSELNKKGKIFIEKRNELNDKFSQYQELIQSLKNEIKNTEQGTLEQLIQKTDQKLENLNENIDKISNKIETNKFNIKNFEKELIQLEKKLQEDLKSLNQKPLLLDKNNLDEIDKKQISLKPEPNPADPMLTEKEDISSQEFSVNNSIKLESKPEPKIETSIMLEPKTELKAAYEPEFDIQYKSSRISQPESESNIMPKPNLTNSMLTNKEEQARNNSPTPEPKSILEPKSSRISQPESESNIMPKPNLTNSIFIDEVDTLSQRFDGSKDSIISDNKFIKSMPESNVLLESESSAISKSVSNFGLESNRASQFKSDIKSESTVVLEPKQSIASELDSSIISELDLESEFDFEPEFKFESNIRPRSNSLPILESNSEIDLKTNLKLRSNSFSTLESNPTDSMLINEEKQERNNSPTPEPKSILEPKSNIISQPVSESNITPKPSLADSMLTDKEEQERNNSPIPELIPERIFELTPESLPESLLEPILNNLQNSEKFTELNINDSNIKVKNVLDTTILSPITILPQPKITTNDISIQNSIPTQTKPLVQRNIKTQTEELDQSQDVKMQITSREQTQEITTQTDDIKKSQDANIQTKTEELDQSQDLKMQVTSRAQTQEITTQTDDIKKSQDANIQTKTDELDQGKSSETQTDNISQTIDAKIQADEIKKFKEQQVQTNDLDQGKSSETQTDNISQTIDAKIQADEIKKFKEQQVQTNDLDQGKSLGTQTDNISQTIDAKIQTDNSKQKQKYETTTKKPVTEEYRLEKKPTEQEALLQKLKKFPERIGKQKEPKNEVTSEPNKKSNKEDINRPKYQTYVLEPDIDLNDKELINPNVPSLSNSKDLFKKKSNLSNITIEEQKNKIISDAQQPQIGQIINSEQLVEELEHTESTKVKSAQESGQQLAQQLVQTKPTQESGQQPAQQLVQTESAQELDRIINLEQSSLSNSVTEIDLQSNKIENINLKPGNMIDGVVPDVKQRQDLNQDLNILNKTNVDTLNTTKSKDPSLTDTKEQNINNNNNQINNNMPKQYNAKIEKLENTKEKIKETVQQRRKKINQFIANSKEKLETSKQKTIYSKEIINLGKQIKELKKDEETNKLKIEELETKIKDKFKEDKSKKNEIQAEQNDDAQKKQSNQIVPKSEILEKQMKTTKTNDTKSQVLLSESEVEAELKKLDNEVENEAKKKLENDLYSDLMPNRSNNLLSLDSESSSKMSNEDNELEKEIEAMSDNVSKLEEEIKAISNNVSELKPDDAQSKNTSTLGVNPKQQGIGPIVSQASSLSEDADQNISKSRQRADANVNEILSTLGPDVTFDIDNDNNSERKSTSSSVISTDSEFDKSFTTNLNNKNIIQDGGDNFNKTLASSNIESSIFRDQKTDINSTAQSNLNNKNKKNSTQNSQYDSKYLGPIESIDKKYVPGNGIDESIYTDVNQYNVLEEYNSLEQDKSSLISDISKQNQSTSYSVKEMQKEIIKERNEKDKNNEIENKLEDRLSKVILSDDDLFNDILKSDTKDKSSNKDSTFEDFDLLNANDKSAGLTNEKQSKNKSDSIDSEALSGTISDMNESLKLSNGDPIPIKKDNEIKNNLEDQLNNTNTNTRERNNANIINPAYIKEKSNDAANIIRIEFSILEFQFLDPNEMQRLTYKVPDENTKIVITNTFENPNLDAIKTTEIKNENGEIACRTGQKGPLKGIIIERPEDDIALELSRVKIDIQNGMMKIDTSRMNYRNPPFNDATLAEMEKATKYRAEYEDLASKIKSGELEKTDESQIKLNSLQKLATSSSEKAIEMSQEAIGLFKGRDKAIAYEADKGNARVNNEKQKTESTDISTDNESLKSDKNNNKVSLITKSNKSIITDNKLTNRGTILSRRRFKSHVESLQEKRSKNRTKTTLSL